MLFSMARLWVDVRLSCRPLARCRTSDLDSPIAAARTGRRSLIGDQDFATDVLELHPKVEPLATQQVGDLAQGLFTHVLHLEHFVFAVPNQVAQGADIGVLERV